MVTDAFGNAAAGVPVKARNRWFCPIIFTRPALCSENSVKFSTRSSRRVLSHVLRIITSSETDVARPRARFVSTRRNRSPIRRERTDGALRAV